MFDEDCIIPITKKEISNISSCYCTQWSLIVYWSVHVSGETCVFMTARESHSLKEQLYWDLEKIRYQAMLHLAAHHVQ